MTSTTLHPAPAWSVVAREQLRAVGLALRVEILLVLGLLVALLVISVLTAIRAANDPHMNVGFMYGAAASIPTSILALFFPFTVWRSEEPSRRDYHWSMPVGRVEHTLTKITMGWAFLMVLVAAYVVFLLGLWGSAVFVAGEPVRVSAAWWEWMVPFTAATVAYLLTSALVVGTDHPWRWIVGIAVAFLFVFALLSAVDLDATRDAFTGLLAGSYGLNAAVFGQVEVADESPRVGRWLASAGLWALIGALGLYIGMRRR